MAVDTQENEVKSSENISEKASIPLSDYANKLEPKVKKRYLEKISAIGIDPVLIEGKNNNPIVYLRWNRRIYSFSLS